VKVVTSRYDGGLPPQEQQDGVTVLRQDVLLRVSKGVIMPGMPLQAWKLTRWADVVHLHVPQLDAAYISLIAKILGKPVVLTYHCDLYLPAGLVHWLANQVSHLANHISAIAADVIVTNTRDYAENSSFLSRYLSKVRIIPPPVELPQVTETDVQAFRSKARIQPGQRLIGMAARLATEKGVEYLVQAMPSVIERHPQARVLFMGQHRDVLGEELYAQKLAPLIDRLGDHWTFLGNLTAKELAVFYRECELTVLPSINSTESFGMVQVEAMTCGTPVVASDLPGVRQPVRLTGMGRVVPPADASALAQAILSILEHPNGYRRDPAAVAQRFSPDAIAAEYDALFRELIDKN
jgi:glycosyltransferase involved in cell wall biosynthesis